MTLSRRHSWLPAIALTALASCQFAPEWPPAADYAPWSSTQHGRHWTDLAESAIGATTLTDQLPADVADFCPAYEALDGRSKTMFWAGLLSAMSKYESNFDPHTEFVETLKDRHGRAVVSRGLLQISYESARQERYGCRLEAERELHDPAVNIHCGARILATWVERDGRVAHANGANAGGARYWSALRPSNDTLEKITAITRDFAFCRS